MKNPLKAIKSAFSGKKGKSQKAPIVQDADYRRLYALWPYGTWQKAGSSGDWKQMDNLAQVVLLDTWAAERFSAAEAAAGHALNPGMFGDRPEPIPSDWIPSERILKQLFAKNRWEVSIMHYMVGELTNLRHIRP